MFKPQTPVKTTNQFSEVELLVISESLNKHPEQSKKNAYDTAMVRNGYKANCLHIDVLPVDLVLSYANLYKSFKKYNLNDESVKLSLSYNKMSEANATNLLDKISLFIEDNVAVYRHEPEERIPESLSGPTRYRLEMADKHLLKLKKLVSDSKIAQPQFNSNIPGMGKK